MSDDYETHELEMAFNAGAASRDAEVAELKNQLADNNLFDSDRNQWRNTYRRTISDLTKERDQLREQVNLYEQALVASWPEGAMGDAFDFWNAARKLNTAEPKL